MKTRTLRNRTRYSRSPDSFFSLWTVASHLWRDWQWYCYCVFLQASIPFAVIGSNVQVEGKGRRFRGRLYPWGVVEGTTHKVMFFKKFSSFFLVSVCLKWDFTGEFTLVILLNVMWVTSSHLYEFYAWLSFCCQQIKTSWPSNMLLLHWQWRTRLTPTSCCWGTCWWGHTCRTWRTWRRRRTMKTTEPSAFIKWRKWLCRRGSAGRRDQDADTRWFIDWMTLLTALMRYILTQIVFFFVCTVCGCEY